MPNGAAPAMGLVRRGLEQLSVCTHILWGILRSYRCLQKALLCSLLLSLLVCAGAQAEKLPVRKFTTADGLPSNAVNCVKRDSRGFLWFCTAEGLSRFDGDRFVNYGIDQGLPDRLVTDFLETRKGEYWVGTLRGLARLNPKPSSGSSVFSMVPLGENDQSRHINSLFQDREGVLWVATDGGVYFQVVSGEKKGFEHLEPGPGADGQISDFVAQDHEGNLWIVYGRDKDVLLCRREPGGQAELMSDPFLAANRVTSLFVDAEDRIWLSTYLGLALLAAHPSNTKLFARIFHKRDGLPYDYTGPMFQTSDGRLWVGAGELTEVIGSSEAVRFKPWAGSEQGFFEIHAEDDNGNLWYSGTRLTTHGFVTYGREDGLRTEDVRSIFGGPDGQVYVVTGLHGRYIHRFDGKRFTMTVPYVPGHDAAWDWDGWGWGQIHFQDHLGEWWFATGYGLLRYPKVKRLEELAHTPPKAFYTTRDGLGGNDIFRLYEDSHGDIWISAWGGSGLTRWDRATGRFHTIGKQEGWSGGLGTSYREDRAGNLWFGLWEHDLVRVRRGHFEILHRSDGFPDGVVYAIWLDHKGRIWAGTSRGGLVRIDEPDGEQIHYRVYTTKEGLSSNDVRAITEDRLGRIYFWTGKGVDRLEPETGGLVHYTPEDGLVPAGSDNQEAFCDQQGNLWFGYVGLSRFEPREESVNPPSLPVYISHFRVRGAPLPISELGETALSGLVFQHSDNNLQIEFGSLHFDTTQVLRFQYKLESTDKDWSAPTDVRTVNYADLRPGNYRFAVRVINGRGQTSATPAVVSFRVLAPVWARWWFLTLAAAMLALLGYGLYQFRVNQLLEVERVRTRIASDLHDDVGSGLTQIAILSELAQREPPSNKGERLSRIAELSRELVDGMSEIVWALNPQGDQLADLAQRMRSFASDVFEPRGIEFELHAPIADTITRLRSDARRQVYLIFKEAINNSVRHSSCTAVRASLSLENGQLLLQVSDNGTGIPLNDKDDGRGSGHGLKSMRKRAADLGGSLEVTSQSGSGTKISLRVPLGRKFKDVLKTT